MQEFIGMGRDARALWEEIASLAAELRASAGGKHESSSPPSPPVHMCVAVKADQQDLLLLLRAERGGKPGAETPAHPPELHSVPSRVELVVALQCIW